MRLICLNIEVGKRTKELSSFIKDNINVEIFCFQELFDNGKSTRPRMSGSNMNIYEQISNILLQHNGYFAPHQDNEEGIALFLSKNIKIEQYNDIFVHKYKNSMKDNHGSNLGRNIQHVMFKYKEKDINIVNFHGLWSEKGKIDTPERYEQSKRILEFIKTLSGEIILCGDFNLEPNTEALELFREYGLVDLIIKYNVTSTRSRGYKGEVKYADYIFCTKGIIINKFQVLDDEVSDHLPLYLDFNL